MTNPNRQPPLLRYWWAQQDLNLRAIGYEPSALPLSYGPEFEELFLSRKVATVARMSDLLFIWAEIKLVLTSNVSLRPKVFLSKGQIQPLFGLTMNFLRHFPKTNDRSDAP